MELNTNMFKYFAIYISQTIYPAVHLFNTCVSLKMAAFVVEIYKKSKTQKCYQFGIKLCVLG
jgi:hypothetical protein